MENIEVALFFLACLFLIGALDDLFMDLVHLVFGLYPKKISREELKNWGKSQEKPIAVMIPAWQEHDVLEAMVKTNLKRIKYDNYIWFIGVYPNDHKTLEIAKRLEKAYPEKVVTVVNDQKGPTTKAQCLNRVLTVMQDGIEESMIKTGKAWIPHYVAIHDAEDVIHPYSFQAINAQDDDHDFIQVPIFSLPVSTKKWVAGTYLDEFADVHLREVPVREKLRMPIPSAGVGTFFSHRILQVIGMRFGYWFDEGNLTEDYEISMRIARLGGKQKFMLLADPTGDLIATREYFPQDFGRSVRQKTRWTTGIGLQTAQKWGLYAGVFKRFSIKNLMAAYGVWRDRKALWSNPLVFIAWFVILAGLGLNYVHSPQWFLQLEFTPLTTNIMLLNLLLFGLRLVQRMRFSARVYGLAHGALSPARLFLASVINALAAIRAIRAFSKAGSQSKTVAASGQTKMEWDKTDHMFPTEEELSSVSNL